jgi:hypothetical protein
VKSVSQPDTIALLENNYILFANNRNRVRGAVLCLSQDGACTNLFENFREKSLKRDLSYDTADKTPLFSLVNTFKTTLYPPAIMEFSSLPFSLGKGGRGRAELQKMPLSVFWSQILLRMTRNALSSSFLDDSECRGRSSLPYTLVQRNSISPRTS